MNTVEEAAELLKYRVTGPTWKDATDEELQRYKEEQLQKKRKCKQQMEQVKQAHKYWLRYMDLVLMHGFAYGVLVACGVRHAYEWWRSC